ncbi:MAG TPA: UvrB/UvrC motif-containing protein, partial [Polyangiaceae bacterium]
ETLRQLMFAAAENLQFETAARLRDDIRRLKEGLPVTESTPPQSVGPSSAVSKSARPARSSRAVGRGRRSR